MKQFKMLVLTDHTNHSSENSLYELVLTMRIHSLCKQIDIATKGNDLNNDFFNNHNTEYLYASKVDEDFAFSPNGKAFKKNIQKVFIRNYDVIWLRMPPPLSAGFLNFLIQKFPMQLTINNAKGIQETGSKKFLTHFANCCPPMKICNSIQDILSFKNRFPIVLKPFREYGGKGIIKIDGANVWEGNTKMSLDFFLEKLKGTKIEYLGVKFLKNVSMGDKRIIVVNGKIMGASLRLPAKDSWICNVAMGGSSHYTEADEEEVEIVNRINPMLLKMGIVMYGVDTLVGDGNKRVLSEINTTSIGGLPQIARLVKKPLLEEAVNLICDYIVEKKVKIRCY
jgi:glutathione synthase